MCKHDLPHGRTDSKRFGCLHEPLRHTSITFLTAMSHPKTDPPYKDHFISVVPLYPPSHAIGADHIVVPFIPDTM